MAKRQLIMTGQSVLCIELLLEYMNIHADSLWLVENVKAEQMGF